MDELLCCFAVRDDQKPTVRISSGKMVGQGKETTKGADFVAFTGIPYAEPPLGK
jgi:carboxylesterase type B